MSGSVLWLMWMGAAAWLGRLNGPHAGSRWFAWTAASGLLGGWLLWFIFDRYLFFFHLPAWFIVIALSMPIALAGMGGAALLRTPAPRPWSAWAAAALLVLPLLLLLGDLVIW